jgi:hypothetical protein
MCGLTCWNVPVPGWGACIWAERFRWSAGCGWGELVDLRGRVDAELFEDGGLGWADLGALSEGPGGTGEGADLDPVELAAQLGPGGGAGVLGDAGEQEGEPARLT